MPDGYHSATAPPRAALDCAGMSERPSVSVAAEDLLRRRQRLVARIERVDKAVRQWDALGERQRLPEDHQSDVLRPSLRREALVEFRAMLLEELARLEPDA